MPDKKNPTGLYRNLEETAAAIASAAVRLGAESDADALRLVVSNLLNLTQNASVIVGSLEDLKRERAAMGLTA